MRYLYLVTLLLVSLFLAGCEIKGGTARPVPTGSLPLAASPTPADQTAQNPTNLVAPTPLLSESVLSLGLLNDPGYLLPYHNDPADERAAAPITQLLFPEPLLPLNFTYTTTGILERVPSFENGDVTINTVEVFLDELGLISPEPTETITQVQQINVTFRWNPDLRWADGTPLTAADSLFAYELAQQVNLGQSTQSKMDLLERYEQLDAHTTRAVLKPDFIDPAYLTTYFTPLPRHLLADQDPASLTTSEFALLPVGYGPYQLERRDQGSLRLVRNPHYPGPPGKTEVVSFVFRDSIELLRGAVASGTLDAVALDQPSYRELPAIRAAAAAGDLTVSAAPSPVWEHLDFNLDVELLQDIRVRRAISHALNREAMAEELLGGYGSVLDSWIVPGQWAAAPSDQITRYAYDPDEARRLLDEAGIVDSDSDGLREAAGQPLMLNLLTTQGSSLRSATAQRIRDDLAAIGVGLSVQEVPTAALYSPDGPLFQRGFELALFAWIAGPDPRGWERWSCAGVPSASNDWVGNNFPGWCFFEADRAIRTATTSLDQEERRAAYLLQQQLFTQEVPVLPLFQRVDLVLVSPTLTGVQADSTAPFTWNIHEWARR
ncbi:MAG: peptide ABC transporter substrate-binding protein [Oscillochloridaceae bacterium umkhey_bin13]